MMMTRTYLISLRAIETSFVFMWLFVCVCSNNIPGEVFIHNASSSYSSTFVVVEKTKNLYFKYLLFSLLFNKPTLVDSRRQFQSIRKNFQVAQKQQKHDLQLFFSLFFNQILFLRRVNHHYYRESFQIFTYDNISLRIRFCYSSLFTSIPCVLCLGVDLDRPGIDIDEVEAT